MHKLFLIIVLLFCSKFCFSQVDSVYTGRSSVSEREQKKPKNEEWKKNVTWGSNFQLMFGNPTFVFLSPTIGYTFLDNINVGVGGVYNYTSFRTGNAHFSQSIYGGHSYLRYIIADSYFAQVQYDKLYQPDWYASDPNAKRWVDYVLIGGGFRQQVGERAAMIASIMYNIKPDPLSIYPSRIIVQFGFVAGF